MSSTTTTTTHHSHHHHHNEPHKQSSPAATFNPAQPPLPPTVIQQPATATIRIGSFDILNTIGHGNFSVCKLAEHVTTRERVAIKCIEKKSLDTYHLARLDREINIMRSLDHPNIIKLTKVMVSKSMMFLVLEFAQNGELFGNFIDRSNLL
jgi:carbon catabolite-derepressing protein kinase